MLNAEVILNCPLTSAFNIQHSALLLPHQLSADGAGRVQGGVDVEVPPRGVADDRVYQGRVGHPACDDRDVGEGLIADRAVGQRIAVVDVRPVFTRTPPATPDGPSWMWASVQVLPAGKLFRLTTNVVLAPVMLLAASRVRSRVIRTSPRAVDSAFVIGGTVGRAQLRGEDTTLGSLGAVGLSSSHPASSTAVNRITNPRLSMLSPSSKPEKACATASQSVIRTPDPAPRIRIKTSA